MIPYYRIHPEHVLATGLVKTVGPQRELRLASPAAGRCQPYILLRLATSGLIPVEHTEFQEIV